MLLSIIIPVYNTKDELLYRCLNSLSMQENVNFNDIEVLLIKDDLSNNDLTKYKFDNHSFTYKVIQTSGYIGAGMARQLGIDKCHGDWIYFVDSDDEMFSNFSLCYIINNIQLHSDKLLFTFNHLNEVRGNIISDYGLASLYCTVMKKSILQKYDIRFLPIRLYEDVTFICSYVYLVGWNNIQNCDMFPIYWYHKNNESITQSINDKEHSEEAFKCDLQGILYVDYKMQEFFKYEQSFYIFALFRLMNEINKVTIYNIEIDDAHLKMFKKVVSVLKREIDFNDKNKILNIANQFGFTNDDIFDKINEFLEKWR